VDVTQGGDLRGARLGAVFLHASFACQIPVDGTSSQDN